MEIRDVIHGTIETSDSEQLVVDSAFFQRLRNIKQLGFGETSFPSATHNRFIHSLGALHLAGQAFDYIFKAHGPFTEQHQGLRTALRMAALLHDVGHGPLSHTTEFAMPAVDALQVPLLPITATRRANHEDYTLKIILQSSMTPVLEKALKPWGLTPRHIASIINPAIAAPDSFFTLQGIDYQPLLHQLVSSEIDVDRMDYLMRDSFYAGVSYGKFDLGWLISNLSSHVENNKSYLTLRHRALYTFDDFLISRFHMFLMVYFHHKCVIFDEMLSRYLTSPDCQYRIPSDIEEYVFYDDHHLYTHLAHSKNTWAQRIYKKNPYKMLVEFHSGIPQGEQYRHEQEAHLKQTLKDLKNKGVDYIVKTTTGEFSKYFDNHQEHKKPEPPIFVGYDDRLHAPKYIPLHECTDLFERYSENRSITRVYVSQK